MLQSNSRHSVWCQRTKETRSNLWCKTQGIFFHCILWLFYQLIVNCCSFKGGKKKSSWEENTQFPFPTSSFPFLLVFPFVSLLLCVHVNNHAQLCDLVWSQWHFQERHQCSVASHGQIKLVWHQMKAFLQTLLYFANKFWVQKLCEQAAFTLCPLVLIKHPHICACCGKVCVCEK